MILDLIKTWAENAINHPYGLWAASGLMALESMIAPIPSEVVMPPVGIAVYHDVFPLWKAIAFTSAGSLIGSLISYFMGFFGGKPLVIKVGRWLLLNEHHLDVTTGFFKRWGSLTVFVCRFVPVVRHFISIPAGIARMNILKFAIYTLIGATLWNGFLLWLGFHLEKNWEKILVYRRPIDIGMVALLLLAVVAWYWMNLRNRKKNWPPKMSWESKEP